MEENKEFIQELNSDLPINIPFESSAEEVRQQLVACVNDLIAHDFNRLVTVLYRMDVSETRLKQLLEARVTEDAGEIIAGLIIERQLEKIKSRRQFQQRDDTISDDEKW